MHDGSLREHLGRAANTLRETAAANVLEADAGNGSWGNRSSVERGGTLEVPAIGLRIRSRPVGGRKERCGEWNRFPTAALLLTILAHAERQRRDRKRRQLCNGLAILYLHPFERLAADIFWLLVVVANLRI